MDDNVRKDSFNGDVKSRIYGSLALPEASNMRAVSMSFSGDPDGESSTKVSNSSSIFPNQTVNEGKNIVFDRRIRDSLDTIDSSSKYTANTTPIPPPLGAFSLHSLGSDSSIDIDSQFSHDCDPCVWIVAAGQLEKKRDGFYKGGWSKRFFVLTNKTLYFYLMPKRSVGGEILGLLGDERGKIRLEDIESVRILEDMEGSIIKLRCVDVKKKGLTQSSNTNIDVRASTFQVAMKWFLAMRKARDINFQMKSGFQRGEKNFLEYSGSKCPGEASSFESRFLSPEMQGKLDMAKGMQCVIEQHAIPFLKESMLSLKSENSRGNHLDLYFALGSMIFINAVCFLVPSLIDIPPWMLVNLCFFSCVVYYEKLATEYDKTVFRFNLSTRKAQLAFDKSAFMLNSMLCNIDCANGSKPMDSPVSLPTTGDEEAPLYQSEGFDVLSIRDSEANLWSAMYQPANIEPSCSKSILSNPFTGVKRHVGGRSMRRAYGGDESLDCSWSPCPASIFSVRDKDYGKKKLKVPSAEPLYDPIGMDLIKDDKRIDAILDLFHVPPIRECDDMDIIERSGLPRILIFNVQTPLKMPVPWGSEDPGFSLVYYYAIKPETAASAAKYSCDGRPEIKLFKRFVTDHERDPDIRRRFKGVGLATNFEELGLSSKFLKLNGKPIILFKTAKIYNRAPEVMEIDVMIHKFCLTARVAINGLMDVAPRAKIRGAFLIQGEEEDELPECILGCTALHSLNFKNIVNIRELLVK